MKNILNEKPSLELHGRSLYSTLFVNDSDLYDKTVLDIGCGYGWFELDAIKRECNKIVGVELTENDLKTAKVNINNDKVEFKIGNAIELPFNNNIFDTVVSWEVIEHIPKNTENKMFSEVKRVLKSGGFFYLSTPFDNFFSNIFDPAYFLTGHRHYKKENLIKYAKNNGFVVNKIILNGSLWEILGINNLYLAKWIFRRKPFFEKFINRKQDNEFKKEKGFTNIFVKLEKR